MQATVQCWARTGAGLLLGILFCAGPRALADDAEAAGPEGTWTGQLKVGASELPAVFHISRKGDGLTATMDSPDQGVHGVPCKPVVFHDGDLQIAVPSIGATYLGKLSSDGQEFAGVWQQLGQRTPLTLQRTTIRLVPQAVLIVYWITLVLLSAFFLRLACGLCRTDIPSWRRSVVSALLVSSLAYLTFDFAAYLLMRSLQDVVLQVPAGYSYRFWFHEPIALKWIIISNAGMLRYLPIVFALCVAGTLQVIVLEAQVTFRFGLLIVLLQWGATVIAAYLLALLLGMALSGESLQSKPVVHEEQGEPTSLEIMRHHLGDAADASRDRGEKAWQNLKAYTDPYLADLKEEFAPLVERLPEPVQEFLNDGGWWLVLGILAIIALIWLRSLVRRLWKALTPRRKKKHRPHSIEVNLKEDLSLIGAALTDEGPQRLTVQGLPARLRLIVLSAGTRNAGALSAEMADRVLDWIKPDLAQAAGPDYPRVTVWPPFYSAEGFQAAVNANVPIPEPKGEKSHWVVVTGAVTMGSAILHVALGLYADEANALRFINVKDEHWPSVLGMLAGRASDGWR